MFSIKFSFVYLFILCQGLTIFLLLLRFPSQYDERYCPPERVKPEFEQKIPAIDVEDNSNSGLLFVMILSSPDKEGALRRDSIRNTWVHLDREKGINPTAKNDLIYKFFVGSSLLHPIVKSELINEQQMFGDVVFLPQLVDSYDNLTLKVLHAFVWVAANEHFTFVLKCDDDSYVQSKAILEELMQWQSKGRHLMLYWGFFRGDSTVKKSGKWKENNWFLCDRYLPYAHGGGYVLSFDLVELIARNSPYLTLYKSEDVSVGVWLASFNVNRVHDVRFDTEYVSRGCQNEYLISHKQTIQDMKDKYTNFIRTGFLCKREFQIHPSFEYSWHEFPSKCCKRSFDFI